jgi:hypothetical protein
VLLFFARVQKLEHLQVYGDSKLMIDWALNKCSFKMAALDFWQRRICNLKVDFTRLDSAHVYREFNVEVDCLSFQASSLEEGKLFIQERVDGAYWNDFVIPLY